MQGCAEFDLKRFDGQIESIIRSLNSMSGGPVMQRFPLSSSEFRSVAYDLLSEILEIEFKNGSRYEYYDVPEYHCAGLVKAPSPSAYFYDHIRFEYDYIKLPSMPVQNPRKAKKGKR